MNKYRTTLAGLTLLSGVWGHPFVWADTANANVGVTIISPANVSTAVATQVLFNRSTGVFTLRIPGSSSGVVAMQGSMCIAAELGHDALRILSGAHGHSLTPSPLLALAESNGMLCGDQGVSLSLTPVSEGDGLVIATLSFN